MSETSGDPFIIEAAETIVLQASVADRTMQNPVLRAESKGGRVATLVRLRTKGGAVGECYTLALGVEIKALVDAIAQVAAVIRGRSALTPEACWAAMFETTRRAFFTRGLLTRAIACVDGAVWDLVGKAAGLPLSRLWGGFRNELGVVVLATSWRGDMSEAEFGRAVERLRADGIGGCKFKVGPQSPLGIDGDAQRMRVARAAGGDDFIMIADANQGWTVGEAIRFARQVEPLNLCWLEEPCHWNDDRRMLAEVRAATTVPVAAGQMEITVEGCRDLIVGKSIDACNFDASFGGGATAWRRVAEIAAGFGVRMVQHQQPQIGMQLAASVPNGAHLEIYEREADPFWFQMVTNRPQFVNGTCTLPNDAGWGLTLDEGFIARHRAN
jgi:D-galactarolactone cycloisomerase